MSKLTTELKRAFLAEPRLCGGYEGREARDMIARSIHEGDPFGWSDGALATILHEDGIPAEYGFDAADDVTIYDAYERIRNRIGPFGVFIEMVNQAVSVVHRC